MTVVCPSDGAEIYKTVFAAAKTNSPMYIRIAGAAPNPIVHTEDYDFKIGKANIIKQGDSVAIIANGPMLYHSLEAAKILDESGISSAVINMHTVKPLDTETIDSFRNVSAIITVEEHSVTGGLGSAVAEYIAPVKNSPPHLLIGLPDAFGKSGEYPWLLERYGLTGEGIAGAIKSFL
jgi:transketolase